MKSYSCLHIFAVNKDDYQLISLLLNPFKKEKKIQYKHFKDEKNTSIDYLAVSRYKEPNAILRCKF